METKGVPVIRTARKLAARACAGWGRSVTQNGELYFVNHVTKTTTWSRPQWTGSDGDVDEDHECESSGDMEGFMGDKVVYSCV